MPSEGGPFVKAAVFVDRVIEGKDDVLTLVRVIDRLTATSSGAEPAARMPTAEFQMHAVIMLVSGRARGRYQVRLVREAPDADRADVWSGGIFLEGNNKGHNLNLALSESFSREGTYWYDVFVNEELLTRMPFQVVYQPITAPTTG